MKPNNLPSNFFSIPDKEKDFESYMVFALAIIWWVVTTLIVSIGFYAFPHLWSRWLTLLSLSLFIAVFNLTLNRVGYTRLARWSLTIMLWLFVTIPCYSAGGITAVGILPQMSVILTAGFLLGWRGGLAIGLLTMGTDFWLAYLEVNGDLPAPSVIHTPITRWLSAVIPFGTILALQYYATNHLRSGLTALQREMVKREEAEKIKDQTLFHLEERVKELKALYDVSRLLQIEDTPPEKLFLEIAAMLPAGWQYPKITAARVCISGTTYATDNYKPSEHSLLAEMQTTKGTGVIIEVVYLEPMPESDEGPFLKEERHLINMLVEMLKIDLERKEANEKIRESEKLIKKITDQIPCNTYMFELEEGGLTKMLFMTRGRDEFNHPYDFPELTDYREKLRETLHPEDTGKFYDAMKEAYHTKGIISVQYRIVVNEQSRWRWLQAIPEKSADGKVIWFGVTNDISPLVDYIASIEQIIFDTGHVIRRPIASMLGITKLINDGGLSEKEIKEVSQKLYLISEEIDKFTRELSVDYHEKRQNNQLKIDIASLIDKRDSLFK